MKKLLFLCAFIALSTISLKTSAQSQSILDSLYCYSPAKQECEQLDLRTVAVVRYESFAKCYLEITRTDLLPNTDLEIFKNGVYLKTVNTDQETSFLLENLPLNANYAIKYANSCGEETILTNFYTGKNHSMEGLTISHQLFDVMEEFTKMEIFSLSEYLESESKLNYYEKLSFWQDIAFKDASFSDNLPFGEYPQPDMAASSGSDCKCMLLLTLPSFSPGIKNPLESVDIPTPDGFVPVYSGSIEGETLIDFVTQNWTDDPDKGGFSHILQGRGAARRQYNFAMGRKLHTRLTELSVGGDDDQSTFYSQISIMWFCFGNLFHFADCGCKKDINYTAKYNTRLNTKMELPSCFWCGSKKGMSKAEDWSVLTLTTQTGDMSVLAAGRGVVDSECEQVWNADFFKQVVDIAADVAVALVGGSSGTDWASQIPDIADGINGLLETPIQNVTGCSNKDVSAALIDKKGIISLTPNLGHYLTLYSMGNTHVQGTTSWEGNSYIRSDFNLAVAVPWGYVGDQSEDCCSHGLSSWVIANVPPLTLDITSPPVTIANDSPANIEALKDDIETWLTLHLLGYNNTEYGALIKLSCGYSNKWENNDALNLNINDAPLPYQVFDMMGKSVASGTSLLADMHTHEFMNNLALPKGIYLIRFVVNDKPQAIKIVKP